MYADLYVREKLREMSRNASRPTRMPAGAARTSLATPVVRSLGRLLCRVGERLQGAGRFPGSDPQAGALKESDLVRRMNCCESGRS
jgi:hypothetical protein